MSRRRAAWAPLSEPREVLQSPDSAEHVRGVGQHRSAAREREGRHGRVGSQRSIGSTITVLLVMPLISLIALWIYAAASTVGGAIAMRHDDTLNQDVGGPTQALAQQLYAERADTFAWQGAHGRLSRAALNAQRARTDTAVAAFRAGVAAGAGVEPAVAKPAAATLLGEVSRLGKIRAMVDAGTIAPLTGFQDYNDVVNAIYPFVGAQGDPAGSLPPYQQSLAVLYEGEATDDIAREAALVGGMLASGGTISAADRAVFAQTVDGQRLLDQLGNSPLEWQLSADPFPQVFASPAYANFRALEDRIVAARAGGRLPVSAAAWQAGLNEILGAFTRAETTARVALTRGATHSSDVILLRLFLVGGAGLVAVIISSILLLGFGKRITGELTGLRGAARDLAEQRLPSVVSRLRQGRDVDVNTEAPPLSLRTRIREVAETAAAFSTVQRAAVQAAVEQALLRKGVNDVFRSLARRNQSLLQRQLRMLDVMERATQDPEALAQLFQLDHLTTRMRRQAEGLIILSGAPPGRGWRQPVPVVEVLRGAIGEIEGYVRVDLVTDSPDFMHGAVVADVTHLLAELVENAVHYSPPETRVQVKGGRVANGYVIEIDDRGLGFPVGMLAALNERLARPPEFDMANSDQLGLFVVSRLAARHGIKISLRDSAYGGTTAIVLLPFHLVVTEEEADLLAAQSAALPGAGSTVLAGLGRPSEPRSVQAISLRPEPADDTVQWQDAGGLNGQQPVSGVTQPGLPRRMPMANLAQQFGDAPRGKTTGAQRDARSADQTRNLFSSLQQGWRSGRAAADGDSGDDGAGQ
jgi:signal transduction histidine kinase